MRAVEEGEDEDLTNFIDGITKTVTEELSTFVNHDRPTDAILEERGKVHGDFSLDAATSQRFKKMLCECENWDKLSAVQREALEMICTKLARIMVGNPHHKDHYDDIAGYARLVAQRLPE